MGEDLSLIGALEMNREKRAHPQVSIRGRHLNLGKFFDKVLVDSGYKIPLCRAKLDDMPFQTSFFFTLVALFSPVLAATNQFQRWYPEYRHIFQRILRENCSDEYAFYLAGQRNSTRFENLDRWVGAAKASQLAFPPASCVLEHTSEWMKLNMAGAAVLLGLTPTILALHYCATPSSWNVSRCWSTFGIPIPERRL